MSFDLRVWVSVIRVSAIVSLMYRWWHTCWEWYRDDARSSGVCDRWSVVTRLHAYSMDWLSIQSAWIVELVESLNQQSNSRSQSTRCAMLVSACHSHSRRRVDDHSVRMQYNRSHSMMHDPRISIIISIIVILSWWWYYSECEWSWWRSSMYSMWSHHSIWSDEWE